MADGFIGGLRELGRTVGEAGLAFTTGTPLPQVRQELGEARLGLQTSRDEARLASIVAGAQQLKQIRDPQQKIAFLEQRKIELQQAGLQTQDTDEGIALIQAGRFDELEERTDQAIELGRQIARRGAASAKAFAPETVRKVIGKDEKGEDVFGLVSRQIVFDPATETSRAIETPIEGELVTSLGETVSEKRRQEIVAAGLEEEAKATGKALGEARTAPLVAKTKSTIETAVKLASKEASAKGETLTDLARAEATLPGLRDTVGQLKELALVATSTIAGRIFDTASKELGFGSTKGANARIKFISIINNQVLPLLRLTFGAAFTEREGETLKATMGDPNVTPIQKIEQLNSFIDQKVRDIQAKQREVGQEVTPTEELRTGQPLFSSVLNRNITEQDIQDTLTANPGTNREQLLQQLGVQ